MKIIKSALIVLLVLLFVLSPFIAAFSLVALTPSQYEETFVGALGIKLDRLRSIEEDKIIVVGGSSVAFGLDSELLCEYTGMPVVNFGLYAALGTRLMLDLSRPSIKEGDVVVIAPELDPETLSLYFSAENTLAALDDRLGELFHLRGDSLSAVIFGMWDYAVEKLGMLRNPERRPVSDGVYSASSFNELGDIIYQRDENIMHGYADRVGAVELNPESYDTEAFYEFADYVNDYISYAKRQGARVYFSFSPVNDMGIAEGADTEALVEHLEENIECEFISQIDDYILPAGYFYDTNFHLNDTGVAVRTMRLARDIRLTCDIIEGRPPLRSEEPSPPALPDFDNAFLGSDINERYFVFELDEWGTYKIVGLTEEGKAMTELTVPLGTGGLKVTSIAEGAFAGARLERLIIPKEANIVSIDNGVCRGAMNLSRIDIYIPVREDIMPPASFDNELSGFRIHTPTGAGYREGYFWDRFALIIVEDLT